MLSDTIDRAGTTERPLLLSAAATPATGPQSVGLLNVGNTFGFSTHFDKLNASPCGSYVRFLHFYHNSRYIQI
jgi:hypothetical protein